MEVKDEFDESESESISWQHRGKSADCERLLISVTRSR